MLSKNFTLLFCDIRSFTSLSERYTQQEIAELLNEYRTETVNVILRCYRGLVDKFVGDEIMAEFGLPILLSDHAEQACLAALDIVCSMERWMKEDKQAFDIQIGIQTGDMPAEYIWSPYRIEFTVIGDEVTRGLRLMSANKIYQTKNHIIISEATKNELSDKIVTRELDTVRFEGLTKSDVIFEVVGENDIVIYSEEFLAHYKQGLACYKKREWDKAIEKFNRALFLTEDNVSNMYIERCNYFKEYPPPSDWDGVDMFLTK